MSFFIELRRRNVVRVGIAYVLIAWVLLQGADFGLDLIDAPNWVIQALFLLAAIGLPVVLIFSWVFEMTPEGLKRESEIDRSQSITQQTGRKLDRVIIGILTVAIAFLLLDRFALKPAREPAESQITATAESDPPSVPAKPHGASPSIAVLPFVNMSADAEKEYFSDGMTEEIINALVRIPGLDVAARTSVFAYKGLQRDVRELGAELNVAHVLEGSVRSDGAQLRITAQLIKVDDGFHMWSETFDRELVNVFAIQEEIADSIAKVLTEEFTSKALKPEARSISIEAYDDYLRGRALLRARGDAPPDQALALFRGVTELHPDYAPAWASLAITADVLDDHVTAESAAQRALAIDADNVDALNALAAVYRDTWRWNESESTFEQALAIDPDSSELLEDWAEFLAGTGRVEEQLVAAQRGYEIDALLNPLMGVYAEALMSNSLAERALEVLEGHPESQMPEWLKVTVLMPLFYMSDDEAARSVIHGVDISKKYRAAALAAFDKPQDADALATLRQMYTSLSPLLTEYFLAEFILLHLGETEAVLDQTLADFTQAQQGSSELFFTPMYAGFRQHPRFADLLELIGLPAYWDSTQWPPFCERDKARVIRCH